MRKLKVVDARKILREEEAAKLIDDDEIKTRAIESVEQNGIVFIDEIDKIAKRSEYAGADVSREGVQRDLLPLIEGSPYQPNMAWCVPIIFYLLHQAHFILPNLLI